uniref:Phosphohydrolase n=1 Tax=Elaeophora elaphi TaxID=1147741 RepID=A0A0R3RWU7_9BILA
MSVMQSDDYDIFANKLIIRLIDNLRAKYLCADDARVILMRRGETVSEVFPNWTANAFDDSNLYLQNNIE